MSQMRPTSEVSCRLLASNAPKAPQTRLHLAEALIKTYEVHEEDPVRKCFFSVTRDEQNHEIMCGLAITKMLGHPDSLTYVPKTEFGKRLQKNL